MNRRSARVSGGHPEGYLEAFANICVEAATAIRAAQSGLPLPADDLLPTVEDGVKGLAFIYAAVRSYLGNVELMTTVGLQRLQIVPGCPTSAIPLS